VSVLFGVVVIRVGFSSLELVRCVSSSSLLLTQRCGGSGKSVNIQGNAVYTLMIWEADLFLRWCCRLLLSGLEFLSLASFSILFFKEFGMDSSSLLGFELLCGLLVTLTLKGLLVWQGVAVLGW